MYDKQRKNYVKKEIRIINNRYLYDHNIVQTSQISRQT